jgi:hypothetical protein
MTRFIALKEDHGVLTICTLSTFRRPALHRILLRLYGDNAPGTGHQPSVKIIGRNTQHKENITLDKDGNLPAIL